MTGPAGEVPVTPKMHADELQIDAALVRRLLTWQFPAWAELPLEPVLPWGTDNALFRLGDEMVVRLPRRERTAVTLQKEVAWLPKLAPHLPLAVPIPLAQGGPSEAYCLPWAVYRWLGGENPAIEAIADQDQLATDLARFIAAMQSVDPTGGPPPGKHNFGRGEPLTRRDAATRDAIASLRRDIDVDLVIAIWEEALAAPVWNQPPVWIHGDLDARNLLVENGRLSAVIDFGCLGVGDPACDVMGAWKLLSVGGRAVFHRTLAIDDATWTRSRGWALSQAMTALSYYTMKTNPTLVLEARRWLTEVLAGQD